jgi:hypothetical protein
MENKYTLPMRIDLAIKTNSLPYPLVTAESICLSSLKAVFAMPPAKKR